MKSIKVKCPAKINLTLEIVNKREDGFHNIKSVMQMISLYDFLTIEADLSSSNSITLSGNSNEIPYNQFNLVYKASELFMNMIGKTAKINIAIEKHIPVSAGLAGGSTDAAGTILGLNKIFDNILNRGELHELCAQLGSDLNVCLEGGTLLATSRGEKIEKLPTVGMPVTLIKPKNLGISAKEAYTKYAKKELKPKYNKTESMVSALKNAESIEPYLYNDLEYAVFDDYKELQYIKSLLPNSIMSGSGSTYFILNKLNQNNFDKNYQIIENLEFIKDGVAAL